MPTRCGNFESDVELALLCYSGRGRDRVFTDFITTCHVLRSANGMTRRQGFITSFIDEDRECILAVRPQKVVANSSGALWTLLTLPF